MFATRKTNKLRSVPPSVNKECKIVLKEVDEALVPDDKHSKLLNGDDDYHQDINDQECNNDAEKTESVTINVEEEQNFIGNENKSPVTDKEETADVCVVESITEMMNKNDLRCFGGSKRRMKETNHLQLPKEHDSELSIKYQPPSTVPISDNKLNDQIQQLDEDRITESKYLSKTTSDPSKIETATKDDKCHIDDDNEGKYCLIISCYIRQLLLIGIYTF